MICLAPSNSPVQWEVGIISLILLRRKEPSVGLAACLWAQSKSGVEAAVELKALDSRVLSIVRGWMGS